MQPKGWLHFYYYFFYRFPTFHHFNNYFVSLTLVEDTFIRENKNKN